MQSSQEGNHTIKSLNIALRIAEVPGNPVAMTIGVAAGTRQIAVRGQGGIVKTVTPATNVVRLRIETHWSPFG